MQETLLFRCQSVAQRHIFLQPFFAFDSLRLGKEKTLSGEEAFVAASPERIGLDGEEKFHRRDNTVQDVFLLCGKLWAVGTTPIALQQRPNTQNRRQQMTQSEIQVLGLSIIPKAFDILIGYAQIHERNQ